MPYDFRGGTWKQAFTWRRAYCAGPNRSLHAVNGGDISQQNSGNDLDSAYLFPSHAAVQAEIKSGGWRGGVIASTGGGQWRKISLTPQMNSACH